MQVKLKVLHGSKAGREIGISIPKFIIGRGEGAHLRPRSDVLSRKHCVIRLEDEGKVTIEDLNSRNGTYVNDERIEGRRQLKSGDVIRVGKLEFEVLIDHSIGGTKHPKVKDVKEAVARSAQGDASEDKEDNITDWLSEADELERSQRLTDPETRQFKLDDTDSVKSDEGDDDTEDTVAGKMEDVAGKKTEEEVSEEDTSVAKKKKKEPGKLPKQSFIQTTKDSREAASEMLKKFFNRR